MIRSVCGLDGTNSVDGIAAAHGVTPAPRIPPCTCPPLKPGDRRIGTTLQMHRTCRDEVDPNCPLHRPSMARRRTP